MPDRDINVFLPENRQYCSLYVWMQATWIL